MQHLKLLHADRVQHPAMKFYLSLCCALVGTLGVVGQPVLAQASPPSVRSGAGEAVAPSERSLHDWLLRMSEASRSSAYQGTFVVSSASGAWASARIWHVCDGEQQVERVESLTGTPRSTYRRNDQVITFWPQVKLARTEKRDSIGLFPSLLQSGDNAIPDFYGLRFIGSERVAGFEADVVQLMPRDRYRFGYRIWSEKKTGLVIKLQTLDVDGRVLEQSAFSELQVDVPVKPEQLVQQMNHTEGYRVDKVEMLKTTAAAQGWALKFAVPGFRPVSCLKRPASSSLAAGGDGTLQWIFSDGLATVSLFIETFDRQRHSQQGLMALGATQTLTRQLVDANGGAWWLTIVGEVPLQTLQAFAQGLERRK
jgi:sigma-E factor negative regulatory protein RseB